MQELNLSHGPNMLYSFPKLIFWGFTAAAVLLLSVLSWPARLSPYWTMIWTLPEKSFIGNNNVKTRDIILSLWQWNIDIDVLKSKRTTSQYWRINCLRITCRIKIILIPPAELLCQLCFNLPNPRQTYFGSCEK